MGDVGFGTGGEKLDDTVKGLQMQAYLVIRGFRRRRNKMGLEYRILVSVFTTPEALRITIISPPHIILSWEIP